MLKCPPMCGRYSQFGNIKNLASELGINTAKILIRPRYNIAPSQPILAINQLAGGQPPIIDFFKWGLIPSWSKDPSIGVKMINARSETLTEKPSFRGLIRTKRCLIIADGFYEWKNEGKKKTCWYFRMKDAQPFTFAGFWDSWIDPANGSEIRSATIITGKPNALIAPYHDRMPMIIRSELRQPWMDPLNQKTADVLSILQPYPAEEMEAYPVSNLVNSPAHDHPDCIKPLAGTSSI